MGLFNSNSVTKNLRLYVLNVLRWLDCGLNTVFLLGSYNETVSRRAAYARDAGVTWGCVLCKVLDFINRGHCDNAKTELVGEDALISDQADL